MQRGSCHCGQIRFEVEGTYGDVVECNCSHCSRKGYLLWFVPRDKLRRIADYRVPVTRDLEDAEIKQTAVWSLLQTA